MSYIVRTGNLAGVPTLRHGDRGAYTYARVIVSDRIKDGDNYVDGPSTAYDVAINGQPAESLVATATENGNIRVTFSGDYQVSQYTPEEGEPRIVHNVRADEIAVSLRGQAVSVEPWKSQA